SISISESGEGFSIALIRQCAGSTIGGAAGAPPRPPRPAAAGAPGPCAAAPLPSPRPATGPPGGPAGAGGVDGPAGTSSATRIVVSASEIDFRFSHGVAAYAEPASSIPATIIMVATSKYRQANQGFAGDHARRSTPLSHDLT